MSSPSSPAFDLLERPLHWITVEFPGLKPPEDEREDSIPTKHKVRLRVELVDRDEAVSFFPAIFGKEEEPKLGESELFERIVKDWDVKAGGRRAELNRENIEKLLKVPMFGAAFANAYVVALGGKVAIREEKLDGLPSGGQADGPKPAETTSTAIAPASE